MTLETITLTSILPPQQKKDHLLTITEYNTNKEISLTAYTIAHNSGLITPQDQTYLQKYAPHTQQY